MAPWASALLCTALLQITTAFQVRVQPVIGPALTQAAGVTPEAVGHLAAMSAFGTMVFLMNGAVFLRRLGPVRLLQSGVLLAAASLALSITASWPVMLLAAFLIGYGYGPSPPAGSDILARHAPKQHRSLVFSIKQAGAPLGNGIAGLLVPALVALSGWRGALAMTALLSGLTALLVQQWRAMLDANRQPETPISPRDLLSPARVLEPFRGIRLSPALPWLALAGMCLASVQGCLLAFMTTLLVEEVGYSLVAAGTAYAVMQASGVVGRILMGWVTDRLGSATRALSVLAVASAAMTLLVSRIGPHWSWQAVLLLNGVAGIASVSWNGVMLAETVAVSPPGKVGEATAAGTFFIFAGYTATPSLFVWMVRWLGGYGPAFAAIVLFPVTALAAIQMAGRAKARHAEESRRGTEN
ncbi:MAG: MFS transporter [Alphaproteobacteria bacterium]|nr:MFS transporter [Alphaproteobacteria bacterium]